MEERRGREEVAVVRGNICSSMHEADRPIRPRGTGDCEAMTGRAIRGTVWSAALPIPADVPSAPAAPPTGGEWEGRVPCPSDPSPGLLDLTDVSSLWWGEEKTLQSMTPLRGKAKKDFSKEGK